MNKFNKLKRNRIVALRNFNEELYKYVKAYASIEGRTIASVFEEAIRQWMQNREDLNEVRLWVALEEEYNRNVKVADSLKEREGYAVICNGSLVGVYNKYEEAARSSRKNCSINALIIKLPPQKRKVAIELGLSW